MFHSYHSRGGYGSHSAHSSHGGMFYGLSLDPRCQHNEQARSTAREQRLALQAMMIAQQASQEQYGQQMGMPNVADQYSALNPRYQVAIGDQRAPEPKKGFIPLTPHPYEYGAPVKKISAYKKLRPFIGWTLTALMLAGVFAIGWYTWNRLQMAKIAANSPIESP